MENSDGQPTPSNTARDNTLTDPTTTIECRHCSHNFAKISTEGIVAPSIAPEQACASCEPFIGLYSTLRAREQEHVALLDRGKKHHGRALAHERLRNARVALENFLISVEARNEVGFDVAQAGSANRADFVQLEVTNDTTKLPKPDEIQRASSQVSPPVERLSSVENLPTIKRKAKCGPGASSLERKRIKFTESVEERPEYRGTLEFYRGSKEYVPGRYVVPEGFEYLDTSGSTLTFAKFTGQKKVGATFVDIKPKDDAPEDELESMAIKGKKNANSGKLSYGEEMDLRIEHLSGEANNDRDLRKTRCFTSTTPRMTTRPRRKIAQYDGQNDESRRELRKKPSFSVKQEAAFPAGAGASGAGASGSIRVTGTKEERRWSREDGHCEPTIEGAEAAHINEVILDIQRELSNLQQATVTPQYKDMISTAVRGFFEVLEPLKSLAHTKPNKAEEAEDVPEDDSVYFEALDSTDKMTSTTDALHPTEALEHSEETPILTGAAHPCEGVDEAGVNPKYDAGTFNTKPGKQGRDSSDTLELDKGGRYLTQDGNLPLLSVEITAKEPVTNAKKKRNSKAQSPYRRNSSQAVRRLSTQLCDRPVSSTESNRLSRMSTTAPPDYRSPLHNHEGTHIGTFVKYLRSTRVGFSRKSPAPFCSAIPDLEQSGEQHEDMINSDEHKSNKASITNHTIHTRVLSPPCSEPENAFFESCELPFANPALGATDNDPSAYELDCQQEPGFFARSTQALSTKPSHFEMVGYVHKRFGELVDNRDRIQSAKTQSESETYEESPESSHIDQHLSTTPAGSDGSRR